MRFGLCAANVGPCTRPEGLARVAERAEDLGFESLWVSEHLVLADPRRPPSPMDPDEPILEPVTALAYVAARTSRLRLGTGVVVVPLRNPLVLAKELATLDVLSGGRLLFGVGTGYVEAEFRALGVPSADRGARTDDHLQAILAVWTQEHPAYHGRFCSFEQIRSLPRPVQGPHPPVIVGGASEAALRRAARLGDGWYGWGLDPSATARALERLEEVMRREPRGRRSLEITITPGGPLDPPSVRRYAELGVDRLNLPIPASLDVDGVLRWIERLRTEILDEATSGGGP